MRFLRYSFDYFCSRRFGFFSLGKVVFKYYAFIRVYIFRSIGKTTNKHTRFISGNLLK